MNNLIKMKISGNAGSKKTQGISKGTPSGVLISLALHAGAFFLAGVLVVFSVTQKEEKKFVPPKPVERPKMKLKKPKVQVKKNNKPKPTTRIVTKVKRASMPDIQLPEMSGMADGLVGGIGGFEMVPDLSEITLLGSGQTIGNDFVGRFYDFKRSRSGSTKIMDPDNFRSELGRFVRSGFRQSTIAQYYESPKKLYTTSFCIPAIRSSMAPSAFGEGDTLGYCWMAHYKGQLVYDKDIRFRFRGVGDDVLVVMVDGEVVLNASWPDDTENTVAGFWQSSSADSRRFRLANNTAVVGDWIELKANEPKDMQVIIGEVPGGVFSAMLVVEVDGEEYSSNSQGGPILPIFKTERIGRDMLDRIYETFVRGEASITNGPVFNDLGSGGSSVVAVEALPEEPEPVVDPEKPGNNMRLWTAKNGDVFEAEFITKMGDKAVFRNQAGREVELIVLDLSADDQRYIDLSNPPRFKMSGVRRSEQEIIEMSPYNQSPPPRIVNYEFGAKIEQVSSGDYPYELSVELFVVGQQNFDDNKFVLLDRQWSSFTPTKENKRSHSFYGEPVQIVNYELFEQTFGNDYYGYIIKLLDPNGRVVQVSASTDWLKDKLKNIERLEKNWFFDETGQRVFPTGPKKNY